jgi:hypothetical protein
MEGHVRGREVVVVRALEGMGRGRSYEWRCCAGHVGRHDSKDRGHDCCAEAS